MLSNPLPQLVADILRQPQFKGAAMFRYLGILNSERVIVTGKDALAELFQRYQYDFPKTDLLNLLASPIIGQGLVIVNGDEHKRQRRLLTPVFAMKHMRALEPIMWEKALESTELFTKIVTDTARPSGFSEPINIDHYTGLVGLDIISKAALGVDYQSMKDPDSDLVRNYREVFEPTLVFRWLSLTRLLIPLEWIKKLPLKRVQGGLKAIELLHASFHKEIDKKKALMEKGELKTNDIISLLIRDRHCVDDGELVTHMLTMLGAGHETVAVSITWAVYEFARNPEWQKSIRAEDPAQPATRRPA
jgi:cytochrome P450